MLNAADRWRIAKSQSGQNVFSTWIDTPADETPQEPRNSLPAPTPENWVASLQGHTRFRPHGAIQSGDPASPWRELTLVDSPSLEELVTATTEEEMVDLTETPSDSLSVLDLPKEADASLSLCIPSRQMIYTDLVSRAFGHTTPWTTREAPRLPPPATPTPPAASPEPPLLLSAMPACADPVPAPADPAPVPALASVTRSADPVLVEALLPGVLQALADALSALAEHHAQNLETPATSYLPDDGERTRIRQHAMALVEQARAMLDDTLTRANELADQAASPI
ncbi:MAG: hypothetical protein HQL95_06875 [Magnetococcales bacterium]|nr:hypothetical protein [Magnetococcales bacterium]